LTRSPSRAAFHAAAVLRAALLFGIALSVAQSQSPQFAVASVKPSASDQGGYLRWFPGGRLRAEHVPLRFLIRFAYEVPEGLLGGGPNWLSDEPFDIEAAPDQLLPAEASNDNTVHRLMLRTLLRDRFHLECHFESRLMPVNILSIAKGGPNLLPSPPGRTLRINVKNNGASRTLEFEGASTALIAGSLSSQLKQRVIDQTNLTSNYDGKLEWTFDLDGEQTDPSGPSIYSAIQQQLGFRLQIEKALTDVLVIDSATHPDAN